MQELVRTWVAKSRTAERKGRATAAFVLSRVPMLESSLGGRTVAKVLTLYFTPEASLYCSGLRDTLRERLPNKALLEVSIDSNPNAFITSELSIRQDGLIVVDLSRSRLRCLDDLEEVRGRLRQVRSKILQDREERLTTIIRREIGKHQELRDFDCAFIVYPFRPQAISELRLDGDMDRTTKIRLMRSFGFGDAELTLIPDVLQLREFLDFAFLDGALRTTLPRLLASDAHVVVSFPGRLEETVRTIIGYSERYNIDIQLLNHEENHLVDEAYGEICNEKIVVCRLRNQSQC